MLKPTPRTEEGAKKKKKTCMNFPTAAVEDELEYPLIYLGNLRGEGKKEIRARAIRVALTFLPGDYVLFRRF